MVFSVDASMAGVVTSSAADDGPVSSDAPVQALEILPGFTAAGGLGQGAFLITQPQLNPAISFAGGQIPTDHIIVHTLPVAQVNVKLQM